MFIHQSSTYDSQEKRNHNIVFYIYSFVALFADWCGRILDCIKLARHLFYCIAILFFCLEKTSSMELVIDTKDLTHDPITRGFTYNILQDVDMGAETALCLLTLEVNPKNFLTACYNRDYTIIRQFLEGKRECIRLLEPADLIFPPQCWSVLIFGKTAHSKETTAKALLSARDLSDKVIANPLHYDVPLQQEERQYSLADHNYNITAGCHSDKHISSNISPHTNATPEKIITSSNDLSDNVIVSLPHYEVALQQEEERQHHLANYNYNIAFDGHSDKHMRSKATHESYKGNFHRGANRHFYGMDIEAYAMVSFLEKKETSINHQSDQLRRSIFEQFELHLALPENLEELTLQHIAPAISILSMQIRQLKEQQMEHQQSIRNLLKQDLEKCEQQKIDDWWQRFVLPKLEGQLTFLECFEQLKLVQSELWEQRKLAEILKLKRLENPELWKQLERSERLEQLKIEQVKLAESLERLMLPEQRVLSEQLEPMELLRQIEQVKLKLLECGGDLELAKLSTQIEKMGEGQPNLYQVLQQLELLMTNLSIRVKKLKLAQSEQARELKQVRQDKLVQLEQLGYWKILRDLNQSKFAKQEKMELLDRLGYLELPERLEELTREQLMLSIRWVQLKLEKSKGSQLELEKQADQELLLLSNRWELINCFKNLEMLRQKQLQEEIYFQSSVIQEIGTRVKVHLMKVGFDSMFLDSLCNYDPDCYFDHRTWPMSHLYSLKAKKQFGEVNLNLTNSLTNSSYKGCPQSGLVIYVDIPKGTKDEKKHIDIDKICGEKSSLIIGDILQNCCNLSPIFNEPFEKGNYHPFSLANSCLCAKPNQI